MNKEKRNYHYIPCCKNCKHYGGNSYVYDDLEHACLKYNEYVEEFAVCDSCEVMDEKND